MSNTKQSSIDFIYESLRKYVRYDDRSAVEIFDKIFADAKAMHKEEMIKNCAKMQIIDDVDFDGNVTFIFDPEKNYNETFGGNE